MAADEIKQMHPATAAPSATAESPPSPGGPGNLSPWYTHARFWRAIAGMALALALASVIVMLEISSELSYRSATYHRRIQRLSSRLQQMRGEIATADQRIAKMREDAVARDTLNRILAAPDVRLMRLEPGDADAKTQAKTNAKTKAMIAMSRKLSRAVLEVEAMPPTPPGRIYRLWWTLDGGAVVAATQFQTRLDWRATVPARLPSSGGAISGALVTSELETDAGKPRGVVELKSVPPKATPRR